MICREKIEEWSLQAQPEWLDPDLFRTLSSVPESADSRFERVQSSSTTAVFRFAHEGRGYYLKHYGYEGVRKFLRLKAKVRRLPRIAAQLQQAGFHTPSIVCVAWSGKRMFSVSEAALSQVRLAEVYIRNGDGVVSNMTCFRELFGREIGRLHAAGFVHGDLRWGNVLVRNPDSESPEFIYLDNDRTKKHRKLPSRGRVKNLVQIHFPEMVNDHPASDWDDFWRGYRETCPAVLRHERRWREKVERKALKRSAKWLAKSGHCAQVSR